MAEQIIIVRTEDRLPAWAPRRALVQFFHDSMQPWSDTPTDIDKAFDYCFSKSDGKGGFLVLMSDNPVGDNEQLAGALLMLRTDMDGYVPGHLLLMVSVMPDRRGQGVGRRIIERALEECSGDVKLHVDYENPARRLYERLGFESKYAEMRLKRP
jgi:GNAT superfamily N-acetyltransferase